MENEQVEKLKKQKKTKKINARNEKANEWTDERTCKMNKISITRLQL